MREIKFRAWNKRYKSMELFDSFYEIQKANKTPKELEDFEVMQYVGIKDKNGKEVYEGDIICNDVGCKYVVIWLKNECCYVQSRIINSLFATENGKGEMLDIRYNLKTLIGNIYENPELLESKK